MSNYSNKQELSRAHTPRAPQYMLSKSNIFQAIIPHTQIQKHALEHAHSDQHMVLLGVVAIGVADVIARFVALVASV